MSLKKLSLLTALLSLFLCGSVQAYNCCPSTSCNTDCCSDRCDDCCFSWCSDWTLWADYIYWNVRRDDLDYVTPWDGTNALGRVKSVCPEYQSGFKVGVYKQWCDYYLDFRYTYYRNCSKNTTREPSGALAGSRIVGDFGALTQGAIQYARGRYSVDYDVVDLLLGYRPNWCGCIEPYFFGGLKLAYIDQDYKTAYFAGVNQTGNSIRIKQKVDMDAYGIDLGFGAKRPLWCCISFFGEFSYDILLGNITRTFDYVTHIVGETSITAERANLKDNDCWRTVSVFNYQFGLSYDHIFSDCWCVDLSLAIGYELHHWLNISDFLEYQNEGEEITFDRNLQNLGFDGLFVRAVLTF